MLMEVDEGFKGFAYIQVLAASQTVVRRRLTEREGRDLRCS
jgi:hypothetical protein